MPMPTRRQFLTSAGAAAGVALAGPLAGRARADHSGEQPAHVQLVYDQTRLHRYRPLLDMQYDDFDDLLGLYGWIAESPEYDTDVYVYWAQYSHQEAPWWAPGTGHYLDHEPVQVEVDKQTGEVTRVRASIIHWVKGEVAGPAMPLGPDGRHPELRVFNPHHHYTAAAPDAPLREIEVQDLHGTYDSMLANGLEGSLVPGASREPWIMRYEEDFWRAGEFGLPLGLGDIGLPDLDGLRVRAFSDLGFGETGDLSRTGVSG
jgi:hypothetical protein